MFIWHTGGENVEKTFETSFLTQTLLRQSQILLSENVRGFRSSSFHHGNTISG